MIELSAKAKREREQRTRQLTPTGLLAKLVAPDPSVPFFSATFDNAIKGCPGSGKMRERTKQLAAKRLPLFETLFSLSFFTDQRCKLLQNWAPKPPPPEHLLPAPSSGLHLLFFSFSSLFSWVSTWVCSLRMRSWSELAFACLPCLAFALLQALAAVGWSNYLLATSLSLFSLHSVFCSLNFSFKLVCDCTQVSCCRRRKGKLQLCRSFHFEVEVQFSSVQFCSALLWHWVHSFVQLLSTVSFCRCVRRRGVFSFQLSLLLSQSSLGGNFSAHFASLLQLLLLLLLWSHRLQFSQCHCTCLSAALLHFCTSSLYSNSLWKKYWSAVNDRATETDWLTNKKIASDWLICRAQQHKHHHHHLAHFSTAINSYWQPFSVLLQPAKVCRVNIGAKRSSSSSSSSPIICSQIWKSPY